MKTNAASRFFGDHAGSVVVIFGLLLPCLLGVAALAIEVGYWYSEQNRLQIAADTAAYSALVAYGADDDLDKAIAVGIAQAQASGFAGPPADITITIPAPEGTLGPNSSRATLRADARLFFSALFLNAASVQIGVVSYATAEEGEPEEPIMASAPCMLALKTNQTRAIVLAASVQTNMNCILASNSASNDAIWVEGSATLTADCASTPGTIGTNGGAKVNLTNCTTGSYARDTSTDPLAGSPFWGSVAVPDTGYFADQSISQGRYGVGMPGGNVLQPGKYGKQVEIDGTVTLQPGVYYFTNGFRAAPGSKITGAGVTIYLDQSKTVDVAQNVAWNLTAPTSGPTKDIAIMGNPQKTGGTVRLIGIVGNIEGAVYFPNQTLQTESGPNIATARCTQIVASTIDIRGGGSMSNQCSGSTAGSSGTGGTSGKSGPVKLAPVPA